MDKRSIDYNLLFSVLALIVFGMVMISSVSVYSSFKLTSSYVSRWLIEDTYNYFYVIRNITHVVISVFILGIVTKLNYKFFEKYIKIIVWIILFMLLFVLFKWMTIKWATGWINISWLPFTIQPTEFLKFILIIFLAYFFKKNKNHLSSFKKWFMPFLWIIWVVVFLVWLQPDFWTLMVVLPVSFIMYYITWSKLKNLLVFLSLLVVLTIWVYSYGQYDKETWKNLNKLGYVTKRIDNFLASNQKAISNKTINYQTKQWLIAIWSGWFAWLWFSNSIQKFWYLPEVQWDFIFSVIVEELWFIGAFVLLNFYLYIAWRWFYIANNVDDLFAKYSAVWISSLIVIQAFINIWVNLNIVPLTGITLPFISYWWSSLLSLCIAIWFLLNISRYSKEKPKYFRKNKAILWF